MSRKSNGYRPNTHIKSFPRRCEIWRVVDRDKNHNGSDDKRIFGSSLQGGTRYCIIVSNDTGNKHAPVVEVVYTTTAKKHDIPTHFQVNSTPKPSTVLCEQITPVAKKDLISRHGVLTLKEKIQLDKCLKISLGL